MPLQIQVGHSDHPPKTNDKPCRNSETFFKYVSIAFLVGGMYPGRRDRERTLVSFLKKVFVGVVSINYVGGLVVFCSAAYFRHIAAEDVTRLIAFCLVLLTSLYRCVIYCLFQNSLKELEKYFLFYEEKYGFKDYFQNWISKLKIILRISVITNLVSTPFMPFVANSIPEIACDVYPVCDFREPWKTVGVVTVSATFCAMSMQWQSVLITFTILSFILRKEFKSIANLFKDLTDCSSEEESKLRACVEQHGSLMVLLDKTSDCVQHSSFVSVFMYLPLCGSFIYSTIASTRTATEVGLVSIGIAWSVLLVGSLLVAEALVSVKAREPVQYIWQMTMENFSDKTVQKLNLFMSRLTGDSIGFSIYGLLTINMPTLLGIAGTLVTYVIIVVQFRPTDTSACDVLVRNMTYCITS